MGRYFVLTAAVGLLINWKPCQVRFNSLQLQGSPWFHLLPADYLLDLLLVLLLLPLFSSSLFVFFLRLGPLGLFFVVFFLRFSFLFLFWVPFWVPLGFVLGAFWVPFLGLFGPLWVWFCFGFLFGPFFFPFVSFLLAASVAGFMRNHLSSQVSMLYDSWLSRALQRDTVGFHAKKKMLRE